MTSPCLARHATRRTDGRKDLHSAVRPLLPTDRERMVTASRGLAAGSCAPIRTAARHAVAPVAVPDDGADDAIFGASRHGVTATQPVTRAEVAFTVAPSVVRKIQGRS